MNNRLEAEIRQLKVDGEAKHKRAEILIDDITEMRHLSKFLEQKKIAYSPFLLEIFLLSQNYAQNARKMLVFHRILPMTKFLARKC